MLIEPLNPSGETMTFKHNSADDAINAKLDKIENHYRAIVAERTNFSSVRQWRSAANPVRIRDLLLEVSNVVTTLAARASSSN